MGEKEERYIKAYQDMIDSLRKEQQENIEKLDLAYRQLSARKSEAETEISNHKIGSKEASLLEASADLERLNKDLEKIDEKRNLIIKDSETKIQLVENSMLKVKEIIDRKEIIEKGQEDIDNDIKHLKERKKEAETEISNHKIGNKDSSYNEALKDIQRINEEINKKMSLKENNELELKQLQEMEMLEVLKNFQRDVYDKIINSVMEKAIAENDDRRNKKIAEEEAKRKAAEEEERRKAAEEEAKRKAAEEEAKRKAAEKEAKRKAAEEEAKRKAAEEEAKRKAAEEETKRKAAEEETKRKAAEKEAKRKAAEEETKRKAAEEEAKRKAAEKETKRKAVNEELKKKKEYEEAMEKEEIRKKALEKALQEEIIKRDWDAAIKEDEEFNKRKVKKDKIKKHEKYIPEIIIRYNAKYDTYTLESKRYENIEKSRKEIPNIDIETLFEKTGIEPSYLECVDRQVASLLYYYDTINRTNEFENYIELMSTDRTIEEKEDDIDKSGIEIYYDLIGLYDYYIDEDLDDKIEIYTYEDRKEILNKANKAKKLGVADVKKGFKVAFLEKIDKLVRLFESEELLPSGEEYNLEKDKKEDNSQHKEKKNKNDRLIITYNAELNSYLCYTPLYSEDVQAAIPYKDIETSILDEEHLANLYNLDMEHVGYIDKEIEVILRSFDEMFFTDNAKEYVEFMANIENISEEEKQDYIEKLGFKVVYNLKGLYGKKIDEEHRKIILSNANKNRELGIATVEKKGIKMAFREKINKLLKNREILTSDETEYDLMEDEEKKENAEIKEKKKSKRKISRQSKANDDKKPKRYFKKVREKAAKYGRACLDWLIADGETLEKIDKTTRKFNEQTIGKEGQTARKRLFENLDDEYYELFSEEEEEK